MLLGVSLLQRMNKFRVLHFCVSNIHYWMVEGKKMIVPIPWFYAFLGYFEILRETFVLLLEVSKDAIEENDTIANTFYWRSFVIRLKITLST